jgi:hypothetical protein
VSTRRNDNVAVERQLLCGQIESVVPGDFGAQLRVKDSLFAVEGVEVMAASVPEETLRDPMSGITPVLDDTTVLHRGDDAVGVRTVTVASGAKLSTHE